MKSMTLNMISFVLGAAVIFAVMTVLDAAPTPQDQLAQQQIVQEQIVQEQIVQEQIVQEQEAQQEAAALVPESELVPANGTTETLTNFDVQDALVTLRTQQSDDFAMFGHYLTLIQSLYQNSEAADLYLVASIFQILGDRAYEAGHLDVARQLYIASVPEDRFDRVLSTDISVETRHNYMAQLCRHDHQLELDAASQSCGYFADESVSYPTRAHLAALRP